MILSRLSASRGRILAESPACYVRRWVVFKASLAGACLPERLYGVCRTVKNQQQTTLRASTFPSGVYFYSISMKTKAERSVKFGKMLLVK